MINIIFIDSDTNFGSPKFLALKSNIKDDNIEAFIDVFNSFPDITEKEIYNCLRQSICSENVEIFRFLLNQSLN